jgi:hypothetical protein
MSKLPLTRRPRRAAMAVFSAVLALTVVGAAPAYAGWTTLGGAGDSKLLGCKTPEVGGYGPVWKITLVLAQSNDHKVGGARVAVRRNGELVSRTRLRTSVSAPWDVKLTYASRLFRDRLRGVAGFGDGQGHGSGGRFAIAARRLASC